MRDEETFEFQPGPAEWLAKCNDCRALIENQPHEQELHMEWHRELAEVERRAGAFDAMWRPIG